MVEIKSLVKQLTKFHKIIYVLVNIEVKIDDKDNDLFLLSTLQKVVKNFKDVLIYGKKCTITLGQV